MSEQVEKPEGSTLRYAAVVRISEALSTCREPQELATALAAELDNFLPFDHLHIAVLKEGSNEIEWHAWGKGPLPDPDLPIQDLPGWNVYNSQEPLQIQDLNQADRFSRLKHLLAARGADNQKFGSAIRVPLTTPHRRLGTLGIISDAGTTYSPEDIDFLRMIARVVAFAIDDGLNLKRAQTAQASLQQQNDRLRLLLNLTTSITANLTLKEVLHTVASNVREVMRCDAANIALPAAEPGMFRLLALDFPGSKGFFKEQQIVTPTDDSPPKRALATLKPVSGRVTSTRAAAEGLNTVCFIPLVNHGRALGYMSLARVSEDMFTQDEVDFLSQAAGQIAIAVDNALAYEEILKLKDKLAQEKVYLEDEIRSEMHFEQIVGSSPALKHVLQLVETVAPSDSTVLLLGETGTGKELIARAIHDRSRRKERTFVKLNCAAIPTGLLESELFGHEKGAFTGAITQKVGRMELADQGTLFLDEVGDIPTEIQPKLLRVLQEREFERLGSTHTRKVNIRLIAATNRDLEKMVANREFRSDLFYRLNVFPIRIPPLRDRREDIPLLVSYFVQKFSRQMQKRIDAIPVAVMKGLTAWEWPGNIRELENFTERAVILTRGKSLEAPLSELRRPIADTPAATAAHPAGDDIARIVKETISALNGRKDRAGEFARKQREEIVRALTESNGRVGGAEGAAARMGINRTTLLARMKKFGIDPRQYA